VLRLGLFNLAIDSKLRGCDLVASSFMKSRVSAPAAFAMASLSATVSMAITRPAPRRKALRMANCPTGPQPHTAMVSPF